MDLMSSSVDAYRLCCVQAYLEGEVLACAGFSLELLAILFLPPLMLRKAIKNKK